MPLSHKGRQMTLETYQAVLDKLSSEYPFLSDVQLYSWGEPLLNRELPDIISYTNQKGIASAVSSNLSLKADLENVIKAQPTWFRISLSGFGQEMYAKVHRGGNWSLVQKNMLQLAELRTRFAPSVFVEVNYHLYKHNQAGVEPMQRFCHKLGFAFHPNYAFLDPLDILMLYRQGQDIPLAAEEGRKNLLIDIEEAIDLAQSIPGTDCVSENSIVIQSSLSVLRCNHTFSNHANILASNFLETPLTDIISSLSTCSLCGKCQQLGLHRYYYAYLDKGRDTCNVP